MQYFQARCRQMRFQVGKLINLINPNFYEKLMKKWILFNNSRIQHNLETITSASAFPNATLPSAPSTDEVTCRNIDKLNNLIFYIKLMKKFILFNNSRSLYHLEIFTLASTFPYAILPSAPSSDEVSSREIDELDKPQL